MENLMKLRLHGTWAECAAATERLRRTPGLHITDQSRPFPDRGGDLIRVYLTVRLGPTRGDQLSQHVGGGRRR
jgi:hypothetical protein